MSPSIGLPHATTGVVVGSLDGASANGDGATYVVTALPGHGSVSVWPTGGFIYTPDPRARLAVYRSGVVTTDGFTVTATDTVGRSIAIAVVDVPVHPARAAVVATVPVSDDPEAVTLSPDDSRAYVAHRGAAVVSIIDTATYTLIETVVVGDHPADLAFSPDGTLAYVVHSSGDSASVIDTATHSVVGIVPIADVPSTSTRAVDDAVAVIGIATQVDLANLPRSVAVTTTGTCAFVVNPANATVSVVKIAEPS